MMQTYTDDGFFVPAFPFNVIRLHDAIRVVHAPSAAETVGCDVVFVVAGLGVHGCLFCRSG